MYFLRNAAFAAIALASCGCAAHSRVPAPAADPASVAARAKNVDDGSAKLGAPVYPSAVSAASGGGTASTPNGTLAAFTTTDSFADVYAFYKTHMPSTSQTVKALVPGRSVAAFRLADAASRESTTVTISEKTGRTDILIMHRRPAGDTGSPEAAQ